MCLSAAIVGAALVPIPLWILARGGPPNAYSRAQYLVLGLSAAVLLGAGLLSARGRLAALLIGIPLGIILGTSPIGWMMQIILDRWLGAPWRFGF